MALLGFTPEVMKSSCRVTFLAFERETRSVDFVEAPCVTCAHGTDVDTYFISRPTVPKEKGLEVSRCLHATRNGLVFGNSTGLVAVSRLAVTSTTISLPQHTDTRGRRWPRLFSTASHIRAPTPVQHVTERPASRQELTYLGVLTHVSCGLVSSSVFTRMNVLVSGGRVRGCSSRLVMMF